MESPFGVVHRTWQGVRKGVGSSSEIAVLSRKSKFQKAKALESVWSVMVTLKCLPANS